MLAALAIPGQNGYNNGNSNAANAAVVDASLPHLDPIEQQKFIANQLEQEALEQSYDGQELPSMNTDDSDAVADTEDSWDADDSADNGNANGNANADAEGAER